MRAVDVYTSNVSDPLLTDLGYGLAQGFVEIAAEDYTVQLRPAGESLDNAPIFSQDITLPSKVRKTLVLADEGGVLQFIELVDDLGRVDPGSLQVANAGSANATLDFGSDGSAELTDLAPNSSGRATTPDLDPTTVTVNGTTYGLPARPVQGDVVIVLTDTDVMLLTYSFTVQTLKAQ